MRKGSLQDSRSFYLVQYLVPVAIVSNLFDEQDDSALRHAKDRTHYLWTGR
jgi:hypothetical protein